VTAPEYDAIIVGAGPAGSTAAYYLARGPGAPRVALLEKARFPRDKVCGDAWCAPALDILEDMGVLQQLESEGLVRDTRAGGFISPSGESFVSTGEAQGAPALRRRASTSRPHAAGR
jgi:flavin-dependent dehydrogenase